MVNGQCLYCKGTKKFNTNRETTKKLLLFNFCSHVDLTIRAKDIPCAAEGSLSYTKRPLITALSTNYNRLKDCLFGHYWVISQLFDTKNVMDKG